MQKYEKYRENKSHSDSLFPYNTYICTIPADLREVTLHWHDDMEIIYVKSGKGVISLDFESHYVEAGDIIIALPGQIHGIFQFEGFSMAYENIIFSADMLLSKIADSLNEEFFAPLLSGKLEFNHVLTSDDYCYADFARCLDRADSVRTPPFPKGYKLALKSCLFDLMYAIAGIAEDKKSGAETKNFDRIKDVIRYVEQNYARQISIDEISGICGFSSSHFMKFFKNTMGCSFIDYLNDYRLSMASRMLISSEDTVLSVAADCGYYNLSYFNRLFKRKYKVTPSEFRKRRPEQ
ncbi:MAG: AraC family transcriptional regulator [Butyrivibrio sp.]|nr:AraC family transcriptional regulator [Butyrivibrio sp.]